MMEPRVAVFYFALVFASISSGEPSVPEEPKTRIYSREGCPPNMRAQPSPHRVNTSSRLARLRIEMRNENSLRSMDAFIVTSDDEHQSEYVASHDRRREYVSGFSGSNGDAVITRRHAALWTDGRYFLQADAQLSCDWLIMRDGELGVPSVPDWLRQSLKPGSKVGADAHLIPHTKWQKWSQQLALSNITLVAVSYNMVDKIWVADRPAYSTSPAYVYDIAFAGVSWQTKVENLRTKMKTLGASSMVVTALDEVAWLLNIRGQDIPFNPFVKAFVIVEFDKLHFYVDDKKISLAVRRQLKIDHCSDSIFCTRVHPYETVVSDIRTYSQAWSKVLLPDECVYTKGVSHAIYKAVPKDKILSVESPIIFMKAVKNPVEIVGMRNAHIRDAVALCDFLAELEESVLDGGHWTEWNVSTSLDQYRREQNLSHGISFATIAGFGRNGAYPHYEPGETTSLTVDKSSTLVLDSGGHYQDGTTDVTRTLHFGTPTEFQKEVYTRVLMGQIQLAMLVFPENITTTMVDVLARAPLWKAGLGFMHGTGHGIGAFLGVHESPIHIAYKSPPSEWVPFKEGYFFSDEPGYYHRGQFGVRLENVLEVVVTETRHHFRGPYFGFRPSTLVPYEPKLIDVSLLTSEHRHWLNAYNDRLRNTVGAELKKQMRMRGFYWMMEKTTYIPEYCVVRGSTNRNAPLNFLWVLLAISSITVTNYYMLHF